MLANRINDRLAEALDEANLARVVDDPLDSAAATFRLESDTVRSVQHFHQRIADFIRHVYECGLGFPRSLSPSQARDEAVALLEQSYTGQYATGYHAALLDATDASGPGMPFVLARMTESLKQRQRGMYTRLACVRILGPADWATKCAAAAILLNRCREWLPPELRQCPPDQLADYVPDLAALQLATDTRLQQLTLANFGGSP